MNDCIGETKFIDILGFHTVSVSNMNKRLFKVASRHRTLVLSRKNAGQSKKC